MPATARFTLLNRLSTSPATVVTDTTSTVMRDAVTKVAAVMKVAVTGVTAKDAEKATAMKAAVAGVTTGTDPRPG